MTISTGSRAKVGYVVETTYGTTPTTPQLIELPVLTAAVNRTQDEYDDNSIRQDRMERYSITGNHTVAGTLDVNFAHGVYDELLISLFNNPFATKVLKTGVVRQSFTMEQASYDINQFRVTTGMIVDKADFTIPNNGVVTAKFSVIGKDQSTLSGTTLSTAAYTAPVAGQLPLTLNGLGTVREGGTVVGYVANIAFSIDNANDKNYALGSSVIRDYTVSNAKVTGTVNVYFEDAVMYNKFVNGTASSLDFTMSDGTNTVEINFPNVKYVAASQTLTSSGPIMMPMSFKALYDTVTQSNVVLTES